MKPAVSIIVPLFNDEAWVAAALDSCLRQTSGDFEVICVDDASTDATASIVGEYAARDSRVRLIQQPTNASAFQARRAGVAAAAARFVLFLDGDDELAPNAIQVVLKKASASGADVVGFGVEIKTDTSGVPRRFEAALQPVHKELRGQQIVTSVFPPHEEANGHLWRYLWATTLLRAAYSGFTSDDSFYRANDLPITFLALAQASKYVSVPDRLYRYNFQRGTSGHAIGDVEHFKFLLSGIDPVTAIKDDVVSIGERLANPESLTDSYESARLHIIGNVLRYCIRDTSGDLQSECLDLLEAKVGALQVIRAAADFVPTALDALTRHASREPQPLKPVRNVLLWTAHLRTGGLQSVLVNHAHALIARGYRVTIALMMRERNQIDVPEGVDIVYVEGTRLERLDQWVEICRNFQIDTIIDHHLLYNDNWPWFALTARTVGVPTIGWIHNFSLRPLFDSNQRMSFLATHMPILRRVVTLSPTDVAFWKLQGIEHVVYLPNPPSKLSLEALEVGVRRNAPVGKIELAWWGRLDRDTKQVRHLVETAAELRKLGVDFRMTIIGPDSGSLTGAEVRGWAQELRVEESINLRPGLSPDELLLALTNTHVMLTTSAIEGYQLTIIEAQALGIPVVMYDLPWLTTVRNNPGVITSSPGKPAELAAAVAAIARDRETYARLSSDSLKFAAESISIDVGELVGALLTDQLPAKYSPVPTIEDAQILTTWLVNYSERNIRHLAKGNRALRADAAAGVKAIRELQSIKSGPSFRIGRFLTAIPRRVRDIARAGVRNLRRRKPALSRSGATLTPQPSPETSAAQRQTPQNPDVSFVVPVYNSAPWLEGCVFSLLNQTGAAVEVICIDDGSTDGSGEILRKIASTDARVRVLTQANQGQSVARNRGLELATGRYLVYVDSDDYWPSDILSSLVDEADNGDLDVLLFDATCFKEGDVDDATWHRYATYYQRKREYREARSGAKLMADMRRRRDYRPHVAMYMTRTAYVQNSGIRFIPGIVHQDNPYTFRVLLNAAKVAHLRLDGYARRLRPGSTITTLTAERSARGYFLSYLEMARELQNHALPASTQDQILNIVQYAYEGARAPFSSLAEDELEGLRVIDDSAEARNLHDRLRTGQGAPLSPADIFSPASSLAPQPPTIGPSH